MKARLNQATKIVEKTGGSYVSRAGLKLASVAQSLQLDFKDKVVLGVGSSTGGFTDYALQHGARKVFAVDVGTNQLHIKLRQDKRVESHEKTDIREFVPSVQPDIVVVDVSFVSLREILPYLEQNICKPATELYVMLKPQFEADKTQMSRGIIKNNTVRRQIMREFEQWLKRFFVVVGKADSDLAGAKGNLERFYKLRRLA